MRQKLESYIGSTHHLALLTFLCALCLFRAAVTNQSCPVKESDHKLPRRSVRVCMQPLERTLHRSQAQTPWNIMSWMMILMQLSYMWTAMTRMMRQVKRKSRPLWRQCSACIWCSDLRNCAWNAWRRTYERSAAEPQIDCLYTQETHKQCSGERTQPTRIQQRVAQPLMHSL